MVCLLILDDWTQASASLLLKQVCYQTALFLKVTTSNKIKPPPVIPDWGFPMSITATDSWII